MDYFYQESDHFHLTSINNHALDLEKLGSEVKITRFIRDPRDLVVSGYFYHIRGAEEWCKIVDPEPFDWRAVDGCIPDKMGADQSFSSYLQSLSK